MTAGPAAAEAEARPGRRRPRPEPRERRTLVEALTAGDLLPYHPHSGAHSEAGFPATAIPHPEDPPRFCPLCGRRMVVQIVPTGWTARCSRHDTLESDFFEQR